MGEGGPNPENQESGVSPALGGSHGPAIRVVVSGKPDMEVWLQGVPTPLLNALGSLTKPPSRMKKFVSFCKDAAPAVTSAATVFLSIVAFIYTNHQKNVSDARAAEEKAKAAETRAKAADVAQKKALSELIDSFGKKTAAAYPNPKEDEIAAMWLAAYGDQALPAVKMVLGASDPDLRRGGVLVAQQIYRSESIQHVTLVKEILRYYESTSSPILRRGVVEWLVKMKHELSEEEGKLAVHSLIQSFGPAGEGCKNQDSNVALEVTNFLPIWPLLEGSGKLLEGMGKNCADQNVKDHARNEYNATNKP